MGTKTQDENDEARVSGPSSTSLMFRGEVGKERATLDECDENEIFHKCLQDYYSPVLSFDDSIIPGSVWYDKCKGVVAVEHL